MRGGGVIVIGVAKVSEGFERVSRGEGVERVSEC